MNLNSVVCGLSARNSDNLSNVFAVMFPDSKTATNFSLDRTKYGYSINHGLRPYFKGLTIYDIKKTDVFCVSFDESLNSATQSSEMDVYVRCFDSVENELRHLGFSFMGHATHEDLVKHFSAVLEPLDMKHMYHISMDGPSVNLKFYDVFKDTCLDGIFRSLIDIVVCSLHVIHCAFITGAEASGWKLNSTLKGSHKILHDTPARREDYTSITGSGKFPYYFCGTRWVDSKKVSDQLISLWENIIALSKFLESLAKVKRPSSKRHVNVIKAVDDDLTVSNLSFFSYVASLMEPYLRKYQCDKPMIVFMFKDLKKIFLSLLRIMVKDSVITGKTVQQLREIDLDEDENLLPLKDMNLGFGTEALLKELLKKDVITAKQVKDFREEDYILANKITVDKVDITRNMIKAYAKSHMLYVQHLEEEKKKKVLSEAEVQASAISSDLDVLSQKCKQIKSAMQMMNDEFVECMKLAEQKNDMSFVIKDNRKKC